MEIKLGIMMLAAGLTYAAIRTVDRRSSAHMPAARHSRKAVRPGSKPAGNRPVAPSSRVSDGRRPFIR